MTEFSGFQIHISCFPVYPEHDGNESSSNAGLCEGWPRQGKERFRWKRHMISSSKVQNHPWSKPLGIALKVTGEMCSLAGDAGIPVIGANFYFVGKSS